MLTKNIIYRKIIFQTEEIKKPSLETTMYWDDLYEHYGVMPDTVINTPTLDYDQMAGMLFNFLEEKITLKKINYFFELRHSVFAQSEHISAPLFWKSKYKMKSDFYSFNIGAFSTVMDCLKLLNEMMLLKNQCVSVVSYIKNNVTEGGPYVA